MKTTLALLSMVLLSALGGCGNLGDVSTSAEHVGYAPDGTLVVFTPAGIKLYDDLMKHEKRSIQLAAAAGTVDVPVTFDLSSDGTRAAVGFSGTVTKDIVVYEVASGQAVETIDLDMPPWSPGPIQRVTLSPHGDLVYANAAAAGVYRVADRARLWGVDSYTLGLDPVAFSADGGTVYGVAQTGPQPLQLALEAHDALTGALLYSVDLGGSRLAALVASADGATLVTIESDPCAADPTKLCDAYVFRSAADGSVTRSFPQFAGFGAALGYPSGTALACAPAGDVCASGAVSTTDSQRLVLLFGADGTLLRQLPLIAPADTLAFSPDGATLAVASGDARVFRVSDGALVSRQSYTYGLF